MTQPSFKTCKAWWCPVARCAKDIHCAIPTANWNQGRKRGSVVDCNIDGLLCPLQTFIFCEKRRSQQHKCPQGHVAHAQPLRCRYKIRRRHTLVQPRQQLFVHRLKSNRNLENDIRVVPPQQRQKMLRALTKECAVALNNHTLKACHKPGNRLIRAHRNRRRVKPRPTVIELDRTARPRFRKTCFHLRHDVIGTHRINRCVLPQITHQAAKRTLFVHQKQRSNIPKLAIRTNLLLKHRVVRLTSIMDVPLWTPPGDPGTLLLWLCRVCGM